MRQNAAYASSGGTSLLRLASRSRRHLSCQPRCLFPRSRNRRRRVDAALRRGCCGCSRLQLRLRLRLCLRQRVCLRCRLRLGCLDLGCRLNLHAAR